MLYLFIILILLNCLLIYFYIYPLSCFEKFTNVPLLVYNVQMNQKNIDIIINYPNYSSKIKEQLSDIKNINIATGNDKTNNSKLLLLDTFTYTYEYPNLTVLTIANDDKYCLFLKPKDNIDNEPIVNIINAQKIIGYINDSDFILIKYICISHDIDINLLKLKKLNTPATLNNKYFTQNGIYTLMLFTTMSNTLLLNSISNEFLIDFLNYEGFDINKLNFLIPFVKITNIDLSIPFKKYKNKYSIKTCFAFDMLLCGEGKIENDIDLGFKLNKIIVRFENYDVINFYTMYFVFFKQTMQYLNVSNAHMQTRDNLPILEQFSETVFDIPVDYNLEGYYNNDNQSMTIRFNKINEIPLTLHSKVVLKKQHRIEENGTYFIKSTTNEKTVIQKYLIYETKIKPENDLINISKENNIEGVSVNNINKNDNILIKNTGKFANLINIKNAIFLKLKKDNPENPTYDPRYECYDDQQIKSRGLCESNFDPLGKPKFKKQYWDRRCESNKECPFYQKNKNYKNYHGGCIDSICQMPLGVKSVSYRKYDPESKPMCYNCRNKFNPFCCEDQKDINKYPELNGSPDYAYPLDNIERMNQLKKSAIKWHY